MSRFLVDEDLPRSLASALRASGHDATDVRDEGLRGEPDSRVFAFAQQRGCVVVTADVEFANELVYPPATHHGIILARFPGAFAAPQLVQAIVAAITSLACEEFEATIAIVEPGRVRIRRSPP
jgi:predicted nuclease of predicted toxin-antitoxin system